MATHKRIYVTPSHIKKIFANMRRKGKDFSGRETPLFPTMVVSKAQNAFGVLVDPLYIADEAVTEEPSMQLKGCIQQRRGKLMIIDAMQDYLEKIEADQLLAERLQAKEQEELTIKERAKPFQQLLEKRRKFFDGEAIFEEQSAFGQCSETREEESSKRAGDELEQENAKKQKVDDDQEIAKLFRRGLLGLKVFLKLLLLRLELLLLSIN
ncbi:hypothetical protein Tco_1125270 [Tanacetum coccineum]|uniref:Uncharacterized protein n=1 Tax=Tanacetum coccineum TaxID=301880 RepID=A0ABQ5JA87_9ASTR